MADELFRSHYHELITIARSHRRNAGFGATMETVDVLHKSYLKLSGKDTFQSIDHFQRTVALAIRQVIVDHARKRVAAKRGGGADSYPIDEHADTLRDFRENPEQILEINQLLEKLSQKHPRWIRMVDARYFAGMSVIEAALMLGISESTARRDWKNARAWIAEQMNINPT